MKSSVRTPWSGLYFEFVYITNTLFGHTYVCIEVIVINMCFRVYSRHVVI